MADVTIKGGLTQENAILLLAAVEELGADPSEVRTSLKGFVTSEKIAKQAGLESFDPDAEFNAEIEAAIAEVSEPVDYPVGGDSHTSPVTAPQTIENAQADGKDDDEIVTEVVASGDPADEPVGTPVSVEPPRSGKGSGVVEWRKHAVAQGADEAAVADETRENLIEQYGTKE